MRQMEKKGYISAKVRQKQKAKVLLNLGFSSFFGKSRLLPILCLFSLWILSVFTYTLFRTDKVAFNLVENQIAPYNIYAEIPFSYTDKNYTILKRSQLSDKEPPVFRIDAASIELSRSYFNELFNPSFDSNSSISLNLKNILDKADFLTSDKRNLGYLASEADKLAYLKELLNSFLLRGIIREKDLEISNRYNNIYIEDELSRRMITSKKDISTPKKATLQIISKYLDRYMLNAKSIRSTLSRILPQILLTNLIFDSKKTSLARKKIRESIKSIERSVLANTIIIKKGTKISALDIKKITAYENSMKSRDKYDLYRQSEFFAILLFILLCAFYVYYMNMFPTYRVDNKYILLITMVVSINVIANRLFFEANKVLLEVLPAHWQSSYYLYPILTMALSAILISLLVDFRVGIFAGLLVTFITAMQHNYSFHLVLRGVIIAIIISIYIKNARNRRDIFKSALLVSLLIFIIESIFLLHVNIPRNLFLGTLLLSILNAFVLSFFIAFLLPVCEYIFSITTNITLLELSDLNHPLLQRMQLEAPGSYHHSLMVATISEQTAKAIGANHLLARVSSYFHDIGKLANPQYFTENSYGQNRHEDLRPRMSTLVILNHVKEGIELAKKHKLQKVLLEAIETHHGTSLVYFFYSKAKTEGKASGTDSPEETQYRYPGPLPKSKVAVIISIVDSSEAAARSLKKPTPTKIHNLISEIIDRKILDHQFDNADITIAELAIIKKSIIKILGDVHHTRIEYPKDEQIEPKYTQPTEKKTTVKDRDPEENISKSNIADKL